MVESIDNAVDRSHANEGARCDHQESDGKLPLDLTNEPKTQQRDCDPSEEQNYSDQWS